MCATLEQSLSDADLFQFSSALSELLSVQSMDLFALDLLDSELDTVGASILVRGFRTLFRAAPRTLSSCLDSERGNVALLAERLGVAVCQLPDDSAPIILQLGSSVLQLAFALGWQIVGLDSCLEMARLVVQRNNKKSVQPDQLEAISTLALSRLG
jgi:hypothetical protein